MKVHAIVLAVLAACGGGGSPTNSDPDASGGDGPDETTPDANEMRPPDPNDPVADVPAHQGAYTFGKLTVQDKTQFADYGTWFTNDTTEHRVTTVRAHITRYRDQLLLQDKNAAQVFVYDQATTTLGPAIALPSDAVGAATIRGGLVYIGGLSKVYSDEIAAQMWRERPLPGAGTCHHVVAGKTRLFVMCADPSATDTQRMYSTWANKTMSDVVPLGAVPQARLSSMWITAAPGGDVAYFPSGIPSECIGTATTTTLDACKIPINTVGTLTTARLSDARAGEDGAALFVKLYSAETTDEYDLFEIKLPSLQLTHIHSVEAFATCPDNSVVYQDFVASGRYAGGVKTAVRLGAGGEYDMGCPLVPL
jgi:hypothetical protein